VFRSVVESVSATYKERTGSNGEYY